MLTGRMPPLPERMLAGISGGADSVALLMLLRQRGVEVTAVHVNHGLRAEESDGDERFVRALCGQWNVPLLTYRAEPPENPGEDWARKVRYGFFRRAAEETGVRTIALAHHRDDQAETLLLHLLRGAGLTGLTGMAADVTRDGLRILRPLLGISRQELRDMLISAGQPWREDSSNADLRYLRNALRGEIIPRLEALVPGAAAHLAGTAAILAGDEAVLDGMAQGFLAQHADGTAMPLRPLRQQPEAMRRRILRAWWLLAAGTAGEERGLSAAQTEALAALTDGPASVRCNLPGGWHGQTGWTHLHLTPPVQQDRMNETPLAECGLLRVMAYEGNAGDGRMSQAIPKNMLQGLTVRTRRSGDWIRPFGSGGRQSLQDYLVNRRVDATFRDRVPLVCRGSEVLLAGGVGAGDIPAVNEKNADQYVLVCWNAAFAWNRER